MLRMTCKVFNVNIVAWLPHVFKSDESASGVLKCPAGAHPTHSAGCTLNITGQVFNVHVLAGANVSNFFLPAAYVFKNPVVCSSRSRGAIHYAIASVM